MSAQMRLATAQAAKQLGLHPANLALRLAHEFDSLEEIWPSIDPALVEILQVGHVEAKLAEPAVSALAEPPQDALSERGILDDIPDALYVLSQMEKHRFWGERNDVEWRKLHRAYCPEVQMLERVVSWLVEKGLLCQDEEGQRYWLEKTRKTEITRAISGYRLRRRQAAAGERGALARPAATVPTSPAAPYSAGPAAADRRVAGAARYCDTCGPGAPTKWYKHGTTRGLVCSRCGKLLESTEFDPG